MRLIGRYIIIALLLSVPAVFSSCDEKIDHQGKTPLVSVDRDFLYKEDVARFYAANLPVSDSLLFIGEYVRNWLKDALLFRVARHNIPEGKDVARLVNDYRKSLILNIYQDKLIEQQLRREITETEVASFYEQNKELFVLDEPMLQGLFLKVAKSAPQMSSVRKWIKGASEQDVENLEKYSLTNAIVYEYFTDNWRTLEAMAAKMPITSDDLLLRLKRDNVFEFSDSVAVYFLNATSLLYKGEQQPLDMATGKIQNLLVNSLKVNFMNEVKRDLFNQALESGDIKFYDKGSSAIIEEQSSVAEQETVSK